MSAPPEPDHLESAAAAEAEATLVGSNFIRDVMERDLASGLHTTIVTRFPPEPNGYAHIGHAFASYLDFGLAEDFGGYCHLRFDDTNPEVEEARYATSIEEDMRWLGWRWERTHFASDYFERLYAMALRLIAMGDAYVDSLNAEEIQRLRGTVEEPGAPSPYRDRSPSENEALFRRMRAGEFPDGAHVLRAKIDMGSPNMKLRDPLLYRINHAPHYRTGSDWPIYPFYDFQHPLSDAIEGVTHSLCSLEFLDNRPLYDWLVDRLMPSPQQPRQYEFGRRSLAYTVVSKRKLARLVAGGHVDGWDDPRMPTLAGLRRRGVRPEAIRSFASRVGVSRTNRTVDAAQLEYSVRDDLNDVAKRVMAVLEPLRLTMTNVARGERLVAPYWPPDVPREGSRRLPFGPELVIERSDFEEDPPEGFKRLAPGRAVRLRHAYVIVCDEVVKDAAGAVTELRCRVLEGTLGRNPKGVKVWGAIHWLSAPEALTMEARLYDRLFDVPDPDAGPGDFLDHLNPESCVVRHGLVEPSVAGDAPDERYQFERLGYFWRDPTDGRGDRLVFDRIVTLKDAWARRSAVAVPAASEAASRDASANGAGAQDDAFHGLEPAALAEARRLRDRFDLSQEDAARLARQGELAVFFEAAATDYGSGGAMASWVLNDLARVAKGRSVSELSLSPADLAELQRMLDDGTVTLPSARSLFERLATEGGEPRALSAALGLGRLDDADALRGAVARVLEAHPEERDAYRAGKRALLGYFIGAVMRETGGRAHPQQLRGLLEAALDEG